ncbi:putative serine/threonine-protein kinase RLCKVII [Triticum urartu]|uniref:Putative serine/threonine-protein kinase RLCKVII n=1 Tax=Triticum urartu TaxID=4572 RepID=M7ZJ55_TRIUA|nr:putative serine/threonine-protein kinase RLCKVII [Triticum urartu]
MASRLASCFPCVSTRKKEVPPSPPAYPRSRNSAAPQTFSFEEIAAATSNFSDDCRLVGLEGLYKGYLKSINQVVAIRLQPVIDPHASADQEIMKFLGHVLKISALRHPNLLSLVGFCAVGDHRILVHESISGQITAGLEHKDDHCRRRGQRVAAGVARGLKYLHDEGFVYPCMRSRDIFLGDGYHPKLSQYGLAEHDRLAAQLAKGWNVRFPRDITFAETWMVGKPLPESSVYGFGVVLLEMITGRRAFNDDQDAVGDRHLVQWAQPFLANVRQFELCRMADPALQGRYPSFDLRKAVAYAGLCIQERPDKRARIDTVVKMKLEYNK